MKKDIEDIEEFVKDLLKDYDSFIEMRLMKIKEAKEFADGFSDTESVIFRSKLMQERAMLCRLKDEIEENK